MKSLDAQKAVEVHRSTCESMGLLDSCLALGNMHYVGHGGWLLQCMYIYTLCTNKLISKIIFLSGTHASVKNACVELLVT